MGFKKYFTLLTANKEKYTINSNTGKKLWSKWLKLLLACYKTQWFSLNIYFTLFIIHCFAASSALVCWEGMERASPAPST